ncbi:IMPACT family protein [Prevotella veroralis]|uniref:Putative YigZ family protein n=1 Tax=Prevotella veroralis F0319 TaxID=649761 RepID=C9MQD0_9BACT|nr:YigZ family protein [Prevotella veroralis]EEX18293.1 putative YigZ family protein [Prevotella veroralis F0319]QUB41296.1 YigZ family protein [Prevotella veroralis]
MDNDKYKTITEKAIGEGFYSESRSKFLAFAHHVDSVEQALEIVKEYRKKYYNARHCCYAYRIGFMGEEFRMNDDGEPSSTAGKPILGQIDSNGLTNTLIIVVRYFGGVKLGTSGLIVAYREASSDAIAHCDIEERFIEEQIKFTFSYPMMNAVMKIVKDMNPRIINQVFDNTCELTLSIRKSYTDELKTRLNKLSFK